jgi:hypothetical protein
MASSRRQSSRRPVFERGPDREIDASALPKIVASDGRLRWDLPDREQRPQTQAVGADSTAPDAQLGPMTAAEQALIASNRAKIEHLKTLPQGADEIELGDLFRVVTRHSGAEIGLSVAGLALQVAGLVPVAVWESVVTTAGASIHIGAEPISSSTSAATCNRSQGSGRLPLRRSSTSSGSKRDDAADGDPDRRPRVAVVPLACDALDDSRPGPSTMTPGSVPMTRSTHGTR